MNTCVNTNINQIFVNQNNVYVLLGKDMAIICDTKVLKLIERVGGEGGVVNESTVNCTA